MKNKMYHDALEYIEDSENIKQDDNGYYLVIPTNKIVCSSCHGNGYHFRSDLDESRLVELMEEDGDYEGLHSYRSGGFDQLCNECHGKNVVDDFDWEYAYKHFPREMREIDDWHASEREYQRYAAQERAFGA